ncbi:MAG: hypothetical protein Q4A55_02305 [Aerococcus sp.]|nr:hypothetical protein [Aerococcus sp.]
MDLSSQMIQTVASLFLFSVVFGFGVYRTISGAIVVGEPMAVLQASNYLIDPLLTIFQANNEKKSTYKMQTTLNNQDQEERLLFPEDAFTELEIHDGSLAYGEKTLFSHLDLKIHQGEKILITAPSGYGEFSLLNILGGFQTLTNGTYSVNEKDTEDYDLRTRFAMIK